MRPKIFDIQDGQIVINEECLLIPQLKAVVDYYDDPIPALSYLYFMYNPSSSYVNYNEIEKEDSILEDYPGDYTSEDEVIIDAAKKLEGMYMTPTYRFYLDNKILMERLGEYGRTATITAGKDGNYSAVQSQLKGVGKTITEFKQLEEVVKKELEENNTTVRGGKRTAYDDL